MKYNSSDKSNFERMSILKDVSEWNEWLAEKQYWNGTFWDDYCITDEVDELKPIEMTEK